MPKPAKPAIRSTRAKAARPDAHPLDEHLAALLNPALVEKPQGLGEAPQAAYATAADSHPRGMSGAAATVESLKALLELGDPNIRDRPPWTPHRPERPQKSEGGRRFRVAAEFEPKGDQPEAIRELVEGVAAHERDQVLLGVTGSGKTFTMAKVIEATQRPALILAPNKTLAAQLYGEFKSFFPDNAVEYFVSYYDYYQPEAYVPRTDTYIEKESSINEQIDRMRHAATRAVLERDDVIIVASVSCIYGIGSVETYTAMTFSLAARRQDRPAPDHRRSRRACNTSARSATFRAACSACAATPSNCSPPTTRIAPGASASSATKSSRSPNSIR